MVFVYGVAWPGVNVSIVVSGPTGVVWSGWSMADARGLFSSSFKLPSNASPGVYVVHAAAGNETALTSFNVVAPLVLKCACEFVNASTRQAYPGQDIKVDVLIENKGSSNGTVCLQVPPGRPFGGAKTCAEIGPRGNTTVSLLLSVPLDMPPGNYSIPLTLFAYWPNGTLAERKICGVVDVEVPPTDVNVTFYFMLPSGEPFRDATVALDGIPVGRTDSEGSLSLGLVANRYYTVCVGKEIEGLKIYHQERIRLSIEPVQNVSIRVVPREACYISAIALEPEKVEKGEYFDIAVRFVIVPCSANFSYKLYLKPEWVEREVKVYESTAHTIIAHTLTYSLKAPERPGLFNVLIVIETGRDVCMSSAKLEVWRRREGCVEIRAVYPDGSPAKRALVRVGGLSNYTDESGAAVVCGLKEGTYTVSITDRLGVYSGRVSDVEIRAFETTGATVYLDPLVPCIETAREGPYKACFSRFADWTLSVPLRVRRCRFALPLKLVARVRGAPYVNATVTVNEPRYDFELTYDFLIPANITATLSPGGSYRIDLVVVDSEGAEVACFEVCRVAIKDDIATLLTSPILHARADLFLVYSLMLIDVGLAILLALAYGGGRDIPVLKTIIRAARKARYPEKAALLLLAAVIYIYLVYGVTNTIINNTLFAAFLETMPLNVLLLIAAMAGLLLGLKRLSAPVARLVKMLCGTKLGLCKLSLGRRARRPAA